MEISTPAGTLSLVNESIVFAVGSNMSTKRLWVRNSKCSLESLSTCGDLITQNLLMLVGKGTGPATADPVLSAASRICWADKSNTL